MIIVKIDTYEAYVLKNENNKVNVRASGLNPEIGFLITEIINGSTQFLTINISNLNTESSKLYYNNIDIDTKDNNNPKLIVESVSLHSIEVNALVKKNDEFNIKISSTIDQDDFSFVVIGDTQGRNDIFGMMVQDINANKPAFVLHCGDMTASGQDYEFEDFLKVTENLTYPIFTTPGNHDIKTNKRIYQSYFGPSDYSFEFGSWKFISLDSSEQKITQQQFTWLENQSRNISGNYKFNKILFTHVPSIGYLADSHGYFNSSDSKNFTKILETNEFRGCFAGHIHVYNHSIVNNINYITTGGGGATPYAPEIFGGFRHFVSVKTTDSIMQFECKKYPQEIFYQSNKTIEITGKYGEMEISIDDLKTFPLISGISSCQNQYGNWVSNGSYTGVPVNEIIEFVGGMNENDTLMVKAQDGYVQEFSYYNVYPNDSWYISQGSLVLSYEYNGVTAPTWYDGPRLITLPNDCKYSLEDCKNTSCPNQGYWEYQSAGARWVKNVISISVAG